MQTQLSLQLAPARKEVNQPHEINADQLLFKKHFQSNADQYEDNGETILVAAASISMVAVLYLFPVNRQPVTGSFASSSAAAGPD